jgi:linoleoyl-CoA desaturase
MLRQLLFSKSQKTMKTIHFKSNDPLQKQFVAELRKNVNNYFNEHGISPKGNSLMIIKAILMLIIYISPFVLLIVLPYNMTLSFALIILMGIGEAGIGMSVMHDASHGAFSNKNWVNTLFSSTIFLLGSSTFNWKVQHTILHHTFTNVYRYDQDIETKAMLRLCQHAPLRRFHRFQFIYAYLFYGLMTLSKLITEFSQLATFNKEGITREQGHQSTKELFKLIAIKITYFSLIIGLPLFFTDYSWWELLLGFCIMHITAGMIMSTIFQMAHVVEGAQQPLPDKNGLIHNEWLVHQLNTTSDFARNNRFLNWYAGGLNFQIEHHLFPYICHIHYQKIAPIVEETAYKFGFVYNLKPTLFDAFVSHAKRLKELGSARK